MSVCGGLCHVRRIRIHVSRGLLLRVCMLTASSSPTTARSATCAIENAFEDHAPSAPACAKASGSECPGGCCTAAHSQRAALPLPPSLQHVLQGVRIRARWSRRRLHICAVTASSSATVARLRRLHSGRVSRLAHQFITRNQNCIRRAACDLVPIGVTRTHRPHEVSHFAEIESQCPLRLLRIRLNVGLGSAAPVLLASKRPAAANKNFLPAKRTSHWRHSMCRLC